MSVDGHADRDQLAELFGELLYDDKDMSEVLTGFADRFLVRCRVCGKHGVASMGR